MILWRFIGFAVALAFVLFMVPVLLLSAIALVCYCLIVEFVGYMAKRERTK